MLDVTELVKDLWGLFVAAIGAVAWLIRLEARGLNNAQEIKRLWARLAEDREAANESRKETHQRIDALREDLREVSRDIKLILQSMPKD